MTQTGTAYGAAIAAISRAPEDSHRDFRQLIEVLGRPGSVGRIDTVDGIPPVITLAAGLADVDVTVAVLDEDWERPFFVATGATRAEPARARHVVATLPLTAGQLATFDRGDALHPEHGARVFAAVAGFDSATGAVTLVLSGPGIAGEATLLVNGLDPGLFAALAAANANFPAGIDIVLVAADGRIAAIPRSSHIQTVKEA